MAKLNTLKASAIQRILIFGPPKAGKSLLAGKLAEHYKLIWIDMENGHATLFQLPEAWQENIELINLPDTRGYPVAIETCLKLIKGPVTICEEHGKVSCMICKRVEASRKEGDNTSYFINVDLNSLGSDTVVVFDSATQLTNSAISNITKNQPDDYKLDYDDWGNLGKLMDMFYSHIQQSKYHVVVISHETEAETEGKKKKLVPVAGTRNFSRNVAKYFDHIVYAEVKNKKHVFSSSTTSSATILTGSRTNVDMEKGDGSLLEIFKPELFNSPVAVAERKKELAQSGKAGIVSTSATDSAAILARLKSKK